MSAPEPAFEAPWHAQLFALTVHMHAQGQFEWSDWGQKFGATLARHGLEKELNGGDDYFIAWLETFEALTKDSGLTDAQNLSEIRLAWERAYLNTPHGAPVRLGS